MKQNNLLIFILILSSITIILNDFVFNETAEIISIGNELGSVLSNLSLAYISSYIFYLIVVVVKEKQDKRNVYISVCNLTDILLEHAFTIYNEVIESTGTDTTKFNKLTITKEEYFKLCEICNPRHTYKNKHFGSVFNPQYANVAQFLQNGTVYNANRYIDKILVFMPFLDTEFIALLNKLRDSQFFKKGAETLITLTQGNIPDVKIGRFVSMFEYLEIAREIEKYNVKNSKKYLVTK